MLSNCNYKLKISGAVLTGMILIGSCSQQDVQAPVPDNENSDGGFVVSDFDGRWAWYQENELLYYILIHQGQIVDLQPASRNAKAIRYQAAKCDLDSVDGLTRLEFRDQANDQGEYYRYQFKFDEFSPGCPDMNNLSGLMYFDFIGMDYDDNPTPALSSRQGVLKRLRS